MIKIYVREIIIIAPVPDPNPSQAGFASLIASTHETFFFFKKQTHKRRKWILTHLDKRLAEDTYTDELNEACMCGAIWSN